MPKKPGPKKPGPERLGPELIRLGCIVAPHGLRGEVRVHYFGDGPENLLALRKLNLARSGKDEIERECAVRGARGGARNGEVLLQLEGVADRDAAEILRGFEVLGSIDALQPLAEGEYYWYQLIGCRVESLDGSDLGVVLELWDAGAHDLLVVENEAGRQVLIPTAPEILREIDLAARLLRVEVIPGLLDSEEESSGRKR